MTKHYKDKDGNLFGFKPDGVEVTEITIEEARELAAAKSDPVDNAGMRAIAYAHPKTGSDRYFVEAARKRAEDDMAGADAATVAGLARVAEIKAEYPLP